MAAELQPPCAKLGSTEDMELGARYFYISNLPVGSGSSTLAAILEQEGVTARPAPQQS
jgi:hypothetical protein